MHPDTRTYNLTLAPSDRAICQLLAEQIDRGLPEAQNKIWHAHPVWFLDGNPVVGYSKLKNCVRLLFWSGQSFDEPGLAKEAASRRPRHASRRWIRSTARPCSAGSPGRATSSGTTGTWSAARGASSA